MPHLPKFKIHHDPFTFTFALNRALDSYFRVALSKPLDVARSSIGNKDRVASLFISVAI